MATNSKKWSLNVSSRLAAGIAATAITTLTVVAIHLLAAYYAASPLIVSTAEWAA
jgi:hypothetical protein